MNYKEQRALALKLFGKLGKDAKKYIKNEITCVYHIVRYLGKNYRKEVLEIIKDIKIPSEWAYMWAKYIGDREIMRDRVTDSQWAYMWIKYIGDREIMRARITESEWAYWWSIDIDAREYFVKKGLIEG